MKSHLILAVLILVPSLAGAFPAYHDISDTPAAQDEARQRHLPIAYLGSFPESLANGSPETGSIDDLTQMALAALQGNAVVIFFNGRNMAPVPPLIHEQYHQQDDGPLTNGAAWISPKVVFCNADITRVFSRVSNTQMKADRDVPLNSALQAIRNNPSLLDPAPAPVAAASPAGQNVSPDTVGGALALTAWIYNNVIYLGIAALLVVVALFALIGANRGKREEPPPSS